MSRKGMQRGSQGAWVPPSDQDRITLFLDLADEHEMIADALGIEGERGIEHDSMAAAQEIAHVSARIASLRKFVIGADDQVYLPTVFDAMEQTFAIDDASLARGLANRVESGRLSFKAFLERGFKGYKYGDEPMRNAHDIVADFISGRTLHADYTKWLYSNIHYRSGAYRGAVRLWVWSAEGLVTATALTIRELQSERS